MSRPPPMKHRPAKTLTVFENANGGCPDEFGTHQLIIKLSGPSSSPTLNPTSFSASTTEIFTFILPKFGSQEDGDPV